jgi:lysophospholipase L1-like esterase
MAGGRRLLPRLLLLLSSVVVSLVVLESVVRIRQFLKYGSASPTVHDFVVDDATGLRTPRPGSSVGGIHINSLGFRGPEITVPKPEGTVRIAFLGAWTTYCAEIPNNELVWPHLVVAELQQQFPQSRFDYVNAAVPGYSTAESLRNLELRVAPLEPDVVVIYHATNDLSGDTRALARNAGLVVGRLDETSWLGEYSALWFLLEKNWTVWRRQNAARRGEGRLQFSAEELSRGFESRLEELVVEAAGTAPVVAIATFSHRIRHEQSDEEKILASSTSLYYMPYMSVEGLLRGFDEYNRVIRTVAERTGSILIGGENRIPGDGEHFVDSVHFTVEGSRKMSERVTTALSSDPAFVAMVE